MIETLKKLSLFYNCSDTEIIDFLDRTHYKTKNYQEGDVIISQDSYLNNLLILQDGNVITQMMGEDSKEIIIDKMTGPQLLASAFLFSSKNQIPVSVLASSKTTIIYIDKNMFWDALFINKTIMANLIKEISDKSAFLSKRLNEFAVQSLEERVLTYLSNRQEIENIQETAFILGVARPSLSRVLNTMFQKGTIKKIGHKYLKA